MIDMLERIAVAKAIFGAHKKPSPLELVAADRAINAVRAIEQAKSSEKP